MFYTISSCLHAWFESPYLLLNTNAYIDQFFCKINLLLVYSYIMILKFFLPSSFLLQFLMSGFLTTINQIMFSCRMYKYAIPFQGLGIGI